MQSIPASIAARIPSLPCACAATFRPTRCASSAIAANSSFEYCCAPAGPVCDMTPPDAHTLISCAPYLIW